MDAATWIVPIVVALITGLFSYLGVSKTVKVSHQKTVMEVKLEQQKQMLSFQHDIEGLKKDLERIEKKQDQHNDVITRTYKLEQQVTDLEKRIK